MPPVLKKSDLTLQKAVAKPPLLPFVAQEPLPPPAPAGKELTPLPIPLVPTLTKKPLPAIPLKVLQPLPVAPQPLVRTTVMPLPMSLEPSLTQARQNTPFRPVQIVSRGAAEAPHADATENVISPFQMQPVRMTGATQAALTEGGGAGLPSSLPGASASQPVFTPDQGALNIAPTSTGAGTVSLSKAATPATVATDPFAARKKLAMALIGGVGVGYFTRKAKGDAWGIGAGLLAFLLVQKVMK